MKKTIMKWISWLSLAVLLCTTFLYLAGKMDIVSVKRWMLILTVVWFVSAAFWMWDKNE